MTETQESMWTLTLNIYSWSAIIGQLEMIKKDSVIFTHPDSLILTEAKEIFPNI